MKKSSKPVRKCHICPLNLGDHCWEYPVPRDQWRPGRHCPGLEDKALHCRYEEWLKQPNVKTRRELRRESLLARHRRSIPRTEAGNKPRRGS